MAFQIYHDRIAILAGFLLVAALFSTAFLYGQDETSLTGYVVMNHGQRISTAKMDPALVQEIAQGNTTPRVIVLLEDEEHLLQDENETHKKQLQFLGELRYKVDVANANETQENPDADFILHKDFENTNAIAGQIKSGNALLEITKSSKVKKIILDYPIQVTLEESAPRIGAPLAWESNYTGKGLTSCIIDTGIQYDHSAFGSCQAHSFIEKGDVVNIEHIESSHPYPNNAIQTFTITQPGFENIALHITNLSLEEIGQTDTLDRLYILDSSDRIVAIYKGSRSDFWTPHVPGDTIKVQLVSDSAVNSYGFYIDQALNGTTNTTIDWSNCSAIVGGYDTFNDDTDPYDGQGHGTHVAGIIASRDQTYRGIAPDANLAIVKALSDQGSGYGSDIVAGLEWCISNAKRFNVTVISMSLGCSGPSCPHYQNYCQNDITAPLIGKATSQNISVVIASGNDGWSDGISNPACAPGATAVGAVNDADNVIFNRGQLLELVAPGYTITSAYLDNTFRSLSGTSMATPHVSGSLLLAYQYAKDHNLSVTPQDLKTLLSTNGLQVYDANSDQNYSRVDLGGLFQVHENEQEIQNSSFQILSPLNGSYYKGPLNLTIHTQQITNISATVGNMTFVNNESLYQELDLEDGTYQLRVTATTANQSVQTQENTFTLDTTAPSLNLHYTNNSNEYTLNISVNDVALKSVFLSSNTTGSWQNTTLHENQSYSHTFSVENSGEFYVTASDLAGNVNQSEHVSILKIKEEQEPQENISILQPTYNGAFELGIIDFIASHNGTWQFSDQNVSNISYSKEFDPGNYIVFFHAQNQTLNVSFTVEEQDTAPEISQVLFLSQVHKESDVNQTFTARIDDTNFASASLDLGVNSYETDCTLVADHFECEWQTTEYEDGKNMFTVTARDHSGKLSSVEGLFIAMSCQDGSQNGDEQGIDCGGSCQNTCVQEIASETKTPVQEFTTQNQEEQQIEQIQDVAASVSENQEESAKQAEAVSKDSAVESRVESDLKVESQSIKTHALYGLWAFIALVVIAYAFVASRK